MRARIGWGSRLGLGMLALLYVATLAGYVGALELGYARSGWLSALREVELYLFVPLPCLAIAAMVLRARIPLALALGPTLLFAYMYGPQFVPRGPVAATGPSFRVLSFNIGAGMGLGAAEPVLQAVHRARPDVICLQEVQGRSVEAIVSSLSADYPYQMRQDGTFIFSRFPLLDSRPLRLRSGAHTGLLTDVEVDHRLVAVANVHLWRVDQFEGWGRGMRSLVRAGNDFATIERDAAVRELLGILRDVWGPRVLVGDFNMSPGSDAYRTLTAELRDSYREAGWGFGHTHPSHLGPTAPDLSLPLQRIDYIFHSDGLVTLSAQVGPDGGSNHLPILADLALR